MCFSLGSDVVPLLTEQPVMQTSSLSSRQRRLSLKQAVRASKRIHRQLQPGVRRRLPCGRRAAMRSCAVVAVVREARPSALAARCPLPPPTACRAPDCVFLADAPGRRAAAKPVAARSVTLAARMREKGRAFPAAHARHRRRPCACGYAHAIIAARTPPRPSPP